MTMTLSGSGTIAGLVAGGLPDATITQPDLAAGVAGNGPAFSAYLSAAQTGVSANTWTKVNLDAEKFDTANCFSSGKFTPNVAGYYQINANIFFNGNGSNTAWYLSIYKNGSLYEFGGAFGAVAVTNGVEQYSGLIYMNGTTDYIELYGFMSASNSIFNANVGQYTYMSGFLARAA